MPHLVAVPDKFRGTATAAEAAQAIVRGAERAGWTATALPLSDGGDGLLDVLGGLGGRAHRSEVTGPLGRPVEASWLEIGDTAVIEMARASGLVLVGGAAGNDPLAASTVGTGELMLAARRRSVRRVVVGLGGSATTDGGWGALQVVADAGGMAGVELVGACDVETTFVGAARAFGGQKGAGPEQIEVLEERLAALARRYRREYGVDVTAVPGTGAAGGMGGAIVALGGRLCPGFDLVADLVGLRQALTGADLVVTAEGMVDRTSFMGKVVGQVLARAAAAGRPSLVVAGTVADGVVADGTVVAGTVADGVELDRGRRTGPPLDEAGTTIVSLVARFGLDRALQSPLACIEEAVARHLDR